MRRTIVVVLLAALAVALGVTTNMADDRLLPYGPTSVTGAVGEDLDAFPYQVHVSDVQAATSVIEQGLFEARDPLFSDGVWVVVTLSYATQDRIRIPSGARLVLRDGLGREFPVSLRSTGTPWLAGPDTWVGGDLAFEVAPDSLDSLTLVFDPGVAIYGPMPTVYAEIPLDLDPEDVVDAVELTKPETLPAGER